MMQRGRPTQHKPYWKDGQWRVRVKDTTAPSGYRWVVIRPGLPNDSSGEAEAKKDAPIVVDRWFHDARVPAERERTNGENFKLWNESTARVAKYPNQVVSDRQMWNDHVPAWFRTLTTRATTSEHVVKLVAELDEEARKPRGGRKYGPGRAGNIYAVVLAFFRDLAGGKDPTVRLRDFANPCIGVMPPDERTGRAIFQQLYWPEAEALMACPEVPIARARLWAVMLYTQSRIGEARLFEAKDLDTKNRRVKIVKALDPERGATKKTGKAKAPKAGRAREMRMESHLVPLVEQMVREVGGQGRIFREAPPGAPQSGVLTDEQTDTLRKIVVEMMSPPMNAPRRDAGRPRGAVLSQDELAAILDTTQPTVACLLNGTRRASVKLGEKIASAKKTTLASLLGWTRQEPVGATPYIPATSKACEMFRQDLRDALTWAIKERPDLRIEALRPALFDDSDLDMSEPIRSHDLRATGITARHARGDNAMMIRQEVGHADDDVNQLYVRSMLEIDPTRVLGPLPPRLLGKAPNDASEAASGILSEFCPRTEITPVSPRKLVPEEGVEPPT